MARKYISWSQGGIECHVWENFRFDVLTRKVYWNARAVKRVGSVIVRASEYYFAGERMFTEADARASAERCANAIMQKEKTE